MTEPELPSDFLREIVESSQARQAVSWHKPHTGLSPAERFVVTFRDGSRVFVKAAVDGATAEELRRESRVLAAIPGSFCPRILTWREDPQRPVLITEDLSTAYWPADHNWGTWLPGQFDILLHTLAELRSVEAPAWLPVAEPAGHSIWRRIEEEAERFLALGLCSESWFRAAIDGLAAAEEGLEWDGHTLIHNDVRSDNLCFQGNRMVLVDWGGACRGRADHDLASVACTLPLEGGPDPASLMPHGGPWAAYRAAVASHRAYASTRDPAWLRVVLRRLAAIALAWASTTLDLPPWTGKEWTEVG